MIETGTQIKAARALLNWRSVDLAEAAGLHRNAVGYWEGQAVITPRSRQGWQSGPQRILEAFERAGVTFIGKPTLGVMLVQGGRR
ncbi:helix-turn-helix transcriptional regulator [Hyphomicrobium sp.]|uniref:helix-turn-helix transcriptional regulator n=1 Tax=Hyphomicrobium sp. TaxID=82 RepID=UPI002C218534|nr:helix-turn-helix transcriptional regulator [Hyphomicrobium sp.]HRQ25793.1 helix-turn-helix transcriptional regulator [Hyphomicrobium sp.]